jgi:flavin-dependent dehydrogenase
VEGFSDPRGYFIGDRPDRSPGLRAALQAGCLATLGAGAALDGYPPLHRLRLCAPGGVEVVGTTARPSWVVPRRVLDTRLVAAAVRAGVVLERERVRSLRRRDGMVVVNGCLAGRVVIGADGANSVVRRLLGTHAVHPAGAATVTLPGADDLLSCCLSATRWYESM